jgi:hypothetical protein
MTQTASHPRSEKALPPRQDVRHLVDDLSHLVHRPAAGETRTVGEAWVAAVRDALGHLHNRLHALYEEEERAGLPTPLIARLPHIADRVASLRRERGRVLVEFETLLATTDRAEASGPDFYAHLQAGTVEALERLMQQQEFEVERPFLIYR